MNTINGNFFFDNKISLKNSDQLVDTNLSVSKTANNAVKMTSDEVIIQNKSKLANNNFISFLDSAKTTDIKNNTNGFTTKGELCIKIENDKPIVSRKEVNSNSKEAELSRRQTAYKVFEKLHFAQKDEVYNGSLEITQNQKDLFHKFALTDIGSNWIQKVLDDDITAFNQGFLETNTNVDYNKSEFINVISGKISTEGEFSGHNIFKVFSYEGFGAQGQSGLIGLGNQGFKESFITGEKVDPVAILAHEFGHTKWGNPSSGETLEGEAETVSKYENPMRKANGYEEREIYYSPKEDKSIEIKSKEIHQGIFKHK